jgi:phage tail sheath protein FI
MVYDFIGEDISPLDLETVKTQKRRGLRNLEAVGEVSLLDVPDIHVQPVSLPETAPGPPCKVDICLPPVSLPPAPPRTASTPELPPVFSDVEIFLVQDALIQQCEKLGDRLALLSQPYSACREDDLGIAAVLAWRRRFDSKYAALFYPWLRLRDPLQAALGGWRDLPATGHVAGQCAATDFDTGVHKAPANAPLAWVQDVTAMVDDTTHGVLNAAGINVIRPRPARGLRLLGARTVSSDPDWRYVNVRRLLNMMKRAIDLSTQWAAFAPNDVFTRAKLRLSLINFLASLWQRGALMGGAMEEAFFVKCDEENNPPRERDQGKLIVEIGVAPSVPFEFIVLRVGRTGNEVEIAELPGRQGG